MANPWQDLRNAAAARLRDRCSALPAADAVGLWVGEDDEAVYARARKYGAAAWLRIQRVEKDPDAEPRAVRARRVLLEVLAVSAGAMRDRVAPAEAAEELQWQIEQALNGFMADACDWQWTAWEFLDQDTLATSKNAVAFRIRFRCKVRLDRY